MEANKDKITVNMATNSGMLTKAFVGPNNKKHNELDHERSIKTLNKFIELNSDRIAGYREASKETMEPDLTALFILFSWTSRKCEDEMSIEVLDLGGIPSTVSNTHNRFFKANKSVMVMSTIHNRQSILARCLHGEDVLLEAYQHVLNNTLNDVSDDLRSMLNAHYDLLKTDRDKMQSLCTLMLAQL